MHGKSFCSFDLFSPKEEKFPRGKLAREKSVTLAGLSFPRETVSNSCFLR